MSDWNGETIDLDKKEDLYNQQVKPFTETQAKKKDEGNSKESVSALNESRLPTAGISKDEINRKGASSKDLNKEDKPKSWDEYANKVEKIFRDNKTDYKVIKNGEEYKTVKKSSFLFFKIISIVSLVILTICSGLGLYFTQDGKFQSLVNNSMTCPSINIPNCPTITCPSCNCPSCPSLNCNSSTPLIKLDLANLNCTTK